MKSFFNKTRLKRLKLSRNNFRSNHTLLWTNLLNPIEHVQAIFKQCLNLYSTPPKSLYELWNLVQEVYATITIDKCQRLYTTMFTWIVAVLEVKGRWTSFWLVCRHCSKSWVYVLTQFQNGVSCNLLICIFYFEFACCWLLCVLQLLYVRFFILLIDFMSFSLF